MKKIKAIGRFLYICFLITSCILVLPLLHTSAEQNIKGTLDSYIETFIEEQKIPGASVAITRNGKIFYSKAWGVTGETEKKVTTVTPFTIGSISKSLTGLAIMKLVQEGKLHLDDPVQKHISWFKLQDKKGNLITIKHLLTHSSGISAYSGLSIADKESYNYDSIKNNVKSLSTIKLSASPGEKYEYSDANFLILGAVIEEVTNQTYSKYMEQHVFSPLGMVNAAADYNTAYKKGYLVGYQSWLGIPRKSSVKYDNGGAPYGYIAASAKDMVQYIKLFSQLENGKFLSTNNMKLYISPHIQTGENRYYGLGVRISNPNTKEEMIWHSGSTPDSHAELFFVPETGWGGVILTNKNHILEEEALPYLKQGIINILNGEEPVDIPSSSPIVQLIIIGILCLLLIMFMYLLVKSKTGKVRRKRTWRFTGIILLLVSAAVVPSLIYSTKSPWHSINAFAPDIALLIIIMVTLLAINGILLIYFSFRHTFNNGFTNR